jgi:hypothetical protein
MKVNWRSVSRPRHEAPVTPSMTIVTCVESGVLETMVVRMVESLRRFGGRFADIDVVAVMSRTGAPIARSTSRRFDELGVHFVQARRRTGFAWQHFVNKIIATIVAEEQATTDMIAWVDGDVIFLKEPNGLELEPDKDIAGVASDAGVIGTRGESDVNNPYWVRCADLLGVGIDNVPWVDTADGNRIRFYLNAGVYVYRRSTGYGAEFLVDFEKFMRGHVARSHSQVHFSDQVILGLTLLRQRLRWQPLSLDLNYPVTRYMPETFDTTKVGTVSMLHYHDSMSPREWNRLLALLESTHPAVHQWLLTQGPMTDPAHVLWRVVREGFRVARGVQRRAYYRRCGFSIKKPAYG